MLGALLVLAGTVSIFVLLLGPVTWLAVPAKHLHGKAKVDAWNATRQTLLASAIAAGALIGAGFTARTYFLSRRSHFTDRYAKAVAQLASDKLTERLGGIFALEHLMRESDRDHETIVELLAAFIREQAPRDHTQEAVDETGELPWPANDVQAALVVLGRRPERPERYRISLVGASLDRVDLSGGRFARAVFDLASLRGALLVGANLDGALLRQAHLTWADLSEASLVRADLSGARLDNAWFFASRLQLADLTGAKLHGALLAGGRFEVDAVMATRFLGTVRRSGAGEAPTGLSAEQLASAVIDETTELPGELRGRAGGGSSSAAR
jgi:hypothetical protein